MNNCPACQSENEEGVIICRKCGLQFLEMTACNVCETENANEGRTDRIWNDGADGWSVDMTPYSDGNLHVNEISKG